MVNKSDVNSDLDKTNSSNIYIYIYIYIYIKTLPTRQQLLRFFFFFGLLNL